MNDFWLVKVDKAGNITWQKTYGGSQSDEVYSMVATADGGYLLAGSTRSNDGDVTGLHLNAAALTTDAWVIKVDGNGNLVWQKALGGSGSEMANSIVASPDGGCVIAASSDSKGSGDVDGYVGGFGVNCDAWIVKLNATGSIVWKRSVGGTRGDGANAIIAATNGGYIVAGNTSSEDIDIKNKITYGWFHTDALIFHISETGILISHNTYGGGGSEYGLSVTRINDGGDYMMCGYTDSFLEGIEGEIIRGASYSDAWFFPANYGRYRQKVVGSAGQDAFTSIVNVPNVGYIATGYGAFSNTDPSRLPVDIIFYAFDENRNVLSKKLYEGIGFNNRYSIIYTQNRNYVIAGSKTGVDAAGKPASADAWIIHDSF